MLDSLQWIVVPGGPGLSNIYLKYAFDRMPIKNNLAFYNMYGAPESNNKNPTIDAMIDQISQVADEKGLSEYGLISHSFGNYLAIRASQKNKNRIKAIIMLNPIPFEIHAWKAALANIVKKIPEDVLEKVTSLSALNDAAAGIQLFKLIFPYYIGRKKVDLPIDVPLNVHACNAIAEKIPDYNDKEFVASTAVPIVRVVGDEDPFFDDREILPEKTVVIPGVGHYPFFEDADNFYKAMKKAEELLCLQTASMKKKHY